MRFGILKLYDHQLGTGVITDSNGQEIDFEVSKNLTSFSKLDLISFKICFHKNRLLVKNMRLISRYADTRYRFGKVLLIDLF
ncbi:hypothetical protein [Pedobacter agri]|uniref:hypothetical protein n=1 Tax=Pedobacter agri TaxID=454586 RepID=UPI002931C068|nr:hypothetical protein [Pedobacter agri]